MNALDPINAAGLVLNGSMLICLAVVIICGRSKLKARKRTQAVTLLTDGRECWRFCRLLSAPATGFRLPPVTREDRL